MERFLPLKYRRQFEAENYKNMLESAKDLIREGIASL
jgi:hypothetical protein